MPWGGRMRTNRGFTLIELMVTIAVLAIIAMMAAPSFSDMISRQNLSGSAKELQGTLNEARSRSAAMRVTVAVCVNKNKAGATITPAQCIAAIDSSLDPNVYINQNRVLLDKVSKKVDVKSDSLGVMFQPTGTIQTTNTIVLCSNGESKTITISKIGTLDQTTGTCS